MAERILHFEIEGKDALGFDTGLSSQAFAQAKLTRFITQEGLIVYTDGKTEVWKPSAVIERQGSMVIWGPDFKGERFDLLLAKDEQRDRALDALRLWIEVRSAANQDIPLWPAGALIDFSGGRILFPPERLVMRCLQGEGKDVWLDGAESLVNPECTGAVPAKQDFSGEDAEVFTAGAVLYRIMSGALAFPNRDHDLLHQDIREGVFLPLRLAAPGLDGKIAALVDQAIDSLKNTPEKSRPGLKEFRELLGPVHSRGALSFFRVPDEAEQAKIAEEREQFQKKKDLTVNTRRFVIRNAALIMGICAGVIIAVLAVRSVVVGRAGLPTTAGMESAEVVTAYYGAFGNLDHAMMDACVIKKAGKTDIGMVTNFFVISKVRQAYESGPNTVIPAQQWIDSGADPAASQVFGVSDLDIRKTGGDESSDEIHYRASYILWLPGTADSSSETAEASAEAEPILPKGHTYTDALRLIRHKGSWRIAEINRDGNQ